MKILKPLLLSLLTVLALLSSDALAYAPIIHEFHSVRAAGMGDVKYTTGLYEENFYANPARVTDNPENRFQLPQFSLEAGTGLLDVISKKGGSGLSSFKNDVGRPISERFQLVFPAYYNTAFLTDFWSLGVGMMVSEQAVLELSQAGTIDPTYLIAAGPAISLGRKLLGDRLSVGVTARTEFRANSKSSFSIQEFLSGAKTTDVIKGGNGIGLDFDLGSTFKPHWKLGGFDYQVAGAINNILGGSYKNLSKPIKTWGGDPLKSNRTYNLGISATHKKVAFLDSILGAIELSDIGNNQNGSVYRTLHIGSEAKWRALAVRAGVNQGYFTGGLGVDLGFFDLNFATYGEELGLNPGIMEDRRYALQFGFQI